MTLYPHGVQYVTILAAKNLAAATKPLVPDKLQKKGAEEGTQFPIN